MEIEEIDNILVHENGYQDEYVYDIEVEDNHMFFANDILVHNSIYYEFGRITSQLNIPLEKQAEFIVKLWELGAGPYMDDCYNKYAKAYNCDNNIQVLELEKIARTGIFTAKKHYAMEESFKEPDIFLKPMEEVLYKGLEIVQGSTPPGARKFQEDFISWCLKWFTNHNTNPDYKEIVNKIKNYKNEFVLMDPESICKGSSLNGYEKYILDDKNRLTIGLHCPIHVNGAGAYNFILNQPENKKYKMKYNMIKTGDKIKFYKTKDIKFPVFSFLPNSFPLEIAPPIDMDQQFNDLVLDPINRIIVAIGYKELNPALTYTRALF